jgi:polyisoprenyl-phosphate glycosyltransferase
MISLIIPCFNEEQNLEKLLGKLNLLLNEFSDEKIEMVIVDNGSTDNSNNIIRNHKLFLDKRISLLNIKKNIGYGDGLNQGINFSKGDVICWFHADLQFDPLDAIKIYKKFKNVLSKEEIFIKGKRINRSLFDNLFTFGMSLLTFLLFKKKINDINAQPKIFKRSFLKFINNPPIDFSFDIYFLLIASKNNIKIIESPVNWYDRNAGIAKGGGSFKLKMKLTLRTIKFMFDLKKIL